MKVRETDHFVPAVRVPVVPFTTLAPLVFTVLDAAQVGGFLLSDGAAPRFYATGAAFADAVDELAETTGWPAVGRSTLVDLFRLRRSEGEWHPESAAERLVPVDLRVVGLDDDASVASPFVERPDQRVFPVIDAEGGLRGWYFNHEPLADTIHTAPPAYVCANNHQHADPDHNRCKYCGTPLTRKR